MLIKKQHVLYAHKHSAMLIKVMKSIFQRLKKNMHMITTTYNKSLLAKYQTKCFVHTNFQCLFGNQINEF